MIRDESGDNLLLLLSLLLFKLLLLFVVVLVDGRYGGEGRKLG